MYPPAKYDSYWQDGGADLMKGHICMCLQASVTRIKNEEVQTKMSEGNVLTTGSGKATQWGFMQRNSSECPQKEMSGKHQIEITAADPAQEK